MRKVIRFGHWGQGWAWLLWAWTEQTDCGAIVWFDFSPIYLTVLFNICDTPLQYCLTRFLFNSRSGRQSHRMPDVGLLRSWIEGTFRRVCRTNCSPDGADVEVLLPRRRQSCSSRIAALPHRVRKDQGTAVRSGDVGLHLSRVDQGMWLAEMRANAKEKFAECVLINLNHRAL